MPAASIAPPGAPVISRAEFVQRLIDNAILWCFLLTSAAAIMFAIVYGIQAGAGIGVVSKPLVGVAVVLAEVAGAALFAHYLRKKEWGWAGAAAVFWVVAFSYSGFLTFSMAAVTNDGADAARISQASTLKDRQAEVKRAEEKVEAEKSALAIARDLGAKSQPMIAGAAVTTAKQAQAVIDAKMADPLFRSSDSCATIKGKQSRKLCGDLAEAQSALAAIQSRGDVTGGIARAERSLTDAEAALVAARSALNGTKTVTSANSPVVAAIATMFPWIGEDNIKLLFAVHQGIVLQVFLSMCALFIEEAARRRDAADAKEKGDYNDALGLVSDKVRDMRPVLIERRVERHTREQSPNDPFARALDRVAGARGAA